ncbi:vacuolar-sorting protein SNF8-like [Teleopsis dalmanni]|uniref:vacuolar-sorting protein SNF8 n=1 Tax=Teleopsis dalmanni TaxID=139649 RepID=UPI000D32CCEB|nr:vacuolar-sorting protein SNF8 [Teleopsis dalmanni]XP_037953314.1 vacuolar-sorting protein SNF8-like [Teleopsis dalmanni]
MRRRAGLGAIQQQQLAAEKYKDKGTDLQESQLEQMTKQMEVFKVKLEEFAMKHKQDIRKNAQFRKQFQDMCAAIGVDPLATGKGFWSVLGMGDFYYELGVQVVEVCLAANHKTGGLMELNELRRRLISARGQSVTHQEITDEDILIAAKKLSIFGNGFVVHKVGKGKYMVQSIPGELSMEETTILTNASNTEQGCITESMLVEQLGWSEFRAKQSLEKVVGEGMCWIDTQDTETSYWFPSLFPGRTAQTA